MSNGSPAPWITSLPPSWSVQRAKTVLYRAKELNSDRREKQVLSLTLRGVVENDPDNPEGLVPEDYATYQLFETDDLVFKLIDLENVRTSRVGLVPKRGIMSSAYLRLRPRPGVCVRYLYWSFFDLYNRQIFNQLGNGVRSTLGAEELLNLPMPLPIHQVQRAIADYLDAETARIDALIAKKQRMIELLEELHMARVSSQISGGEQAALAATADEWFPGLPQGWRVSSVGGVTRAILDGPHTSPTYVEPSEGVPFISVRNISLLGWDLSSAKYISRTDYETFCRRVKPEIGDVLLTKGGNTGIARVVDLPFDFHVWVHVAILKVDQSTIRPHFLAAVLNSMPGYAQSQLGTRGATNQDLVLGRIAKIRLPLPSLPEQDRISQIIEGFSVPIRRAALALSQQIELLREHRQALITSAVTGELEVPGVAA